MADAPYDRAFGEDAVPKPDRKSFKILSPKPGEDVKAQILSDRPIATWGHFHEGRTYPCSRDPKTCGFCFKNISPRWKCYLAAIIPYTGKMYLVEITQRAAYECVQLRDPKCNLRGMMITLHRLGQAKNSPVACRIEKTHLESQLKKLPPAFDVVDAIKNMWGNPWAVYDPKTKTITDEPPGEMMVPC